MTCEHGGNRVPKEYRQLFAGWESVLASHRGYDPGALALARDLARAFDAPLVASTVTRLLVELNRSPGHPQLYSEVTRRLPRSERARIVARYYEPYRREVEQRVAQAAAARRRVIHISAHSFVPVLDGCTRNADIGLLYDPARAAERALCARWSQCLGARASRLRRAPPKDGHASRSPPPSASFQRGRSRHRDPRFATSMRIRRDGTARSQATVFLTSDRR